MIYTKEQVDYMVGTYNASIDADYAERAIVVKDIADMLGASTNSVIGKLNAEGVYKKKEVVAKATNPRIDKEALAKAFEDSFGIKLPSIRNMTAKDMKAFWERFVVMNDIRDAG